MAYKVRQPQFRPFSAASVTDAVDVAEVHVKRVADATLRGHEVIRVVSTDGTGVAFGFLSVLRSDLGPLLRESDGLGRPHRL